MGIVIFAIPLVRNALGLLISSARDAITIKIPKMMIIKTGSNTRVGAIWMVVLVKPTTTTTNPNAGNAHKTAEPALPPATVSPATSRPCTSMGPASRLAPSALTTTITESTAPLVRHSIAPVQSVRLRGALAVWNLTTDMIGTAGLVVQ